MQLMKILSAAVLAGLPVKTVLYYYDIGLVKPFDRSNSGCKRYDQCQIQKLIFARRAREFGFTIGLCRQLRDLYENPTRSSADVRKLINVR